MVGFGAAMPPNLPAGDKRVDRVIEYSNLLFPLEKIVIFGTINTGQERVE